MIVRLLRHSEWHVRYAAICLLRNLSFSMKHDANRVRTRLLFCVSTFRSSCQIWHGGACFTHSLCKIDFGTLSVVAGLGLKYSVKPCQNNEIVIRKPKYHISKIRNGTFLLEIYRQNKRSRSIFPCRFVRSFVFVFVCFLFVYLFVCLCVYNSAMKVGSTGPVYTGFGI